jgi:SulP family sulfate permease
MAMKDHTTRVGWLARVVPAVHWLSRYDRSWLSRDAVASVSVWALLVPQALAYSSLAGVPVQYGLYTAFAALLGYSLFGTSKHMVQGPSAAVSAVVAAVITPLVGAAALGTDDAAKFAAALAIATGVVYVALGVARMGWVSNFLSKAVMGGFVLGFSIGIIIDQSYKLLGVPKVDGSYMEVLWGTIKELPDTSLTTLALGSACLAALLLMRYRFAGLPRALILVVLSIVAVRLFDLTAHGVAVTGPVPTGLFSVGLPDVGWEYTDSLLLGALAVIFVGYSESLASARAMATKHGYKIDPNQELIAEGAACAAAGFVGGYATDGSLSKTSVADAAGQRTQMASILNAVLVLLTMLFLASLFEDLPSAALGAIVIDAMVGLISFGEMRRYWRVNRADFVFFTSAMAGILFVDIIHGILIGVALSLLMLIARASKPQIRRLARDPTDGAYLDIARHDRLDSHSKVLTLRLDGPLFFADAQRFKEEVYELIDTASEPPEAMVLDADSISLTDTDGADALIDLATDLRDKRSLRFAVARVQPPVWELWERAGIATVVFDGRHFDTVHAAVDAMTDGGGPPPRDTSDEAAGP